MRADELKHYDEDTLVHYGVTGMKWGVRKAERNARLAGRFETKAASSRSVMDSSQAKSDHYKTRQAKKVSSYNRRKLREWQEVNDRATKKTEKWEKHAQARREGRMDPTAKKFAIGMMVAGGLAAAGVTYGAATAKDRKVFDSYFGEYARGHKVLEKRYDSIYGPRSSRPYGYTYRYRDATKARAFLDSVQGKQKGRLIRDVSRTATGNRAIDKRIPKAVKKFEKIYGDRRIRAGYGR